MIKPYYQDENVTIYCGDCRDILPNLELVGAIITDLVWPNNSLKEFEGIGQYKTLETAAIHWPKLCKRAVIQLGCNSDPRILSAIPPELPFIRVNWLRYRPAYRGRILIGSDVAYSFGEPPPSRKYHRLISGECDIPKGKDATLMGGEYKRSKIGHPCPRLLQHVRYLVDKFSVPEEIILDPFMGSGVTVRAAKDLGRKSIGIEIKEKYCEIAVQQLKQEILDFNNQ